MPTGRYGNNILQQTQARPHGLAWVKHAAGMGLPDHLDYSLDAFNLFSTGH